MAKTPRATSSKLSRLLHGTKLSRLQVTGLSVLATVSPQHNIALQSSNNTSTR
jgi:hypothetical protein